jgi:hypothetical protein
MESKRPAYLFFSLLVFLLAICVVLVQQSSAGGRLRPSPTAVASAPTELVNRLRADAFTYFRFVNRSWAARVCDAFHDVSDLPIVRLHGDAHVEQYALTDNAWGLTDFDDSARGPEFIDIVRFLGSIDLATRQRGWTSDRDALWDRFFAGYRAGLANPAYRFPRARHCPSASRTGATGSRGLPLMGGKSDGTDAGGGIKVCR